MVYHANYLKFAERARTEWLRRFGIDQSALQGSNGVFVVRHCTLDYRQPARLDDLITVTAEVGTLGAASLTMKQHVLREGDLLVELTVQLAFIGFSGRPVRIPAHVRALIGNAGGIQYETGQKP